MLFKFAIMNLTLTLALTFLQYSRQCSATSYANLFSKFSKMLAHSNNWIWFLINCWFSLKFLMHIRRNYPLAFRILFQISENVRTRGLLAESYEKRVVNNYTFSKFNRTKDVQPSMPIMKTAIKCYWWDSRNTFSLSQVCKPFSFFLF